MCRRWIFVSARSSSLPCIVHLASHALLATATVATSTHIKRRSYSWKSFCCGHTSVFYNFATAFFPSLISCSLARFGDPVQCLRRVFFVILAACVFMCVFPSAPEFPSLLSAIRDCKRAFVTAAISLRDDGIGACSGVWTGARALSSSSNVDIFVQAFVIGARADALRFFK